MQRTKLTEEKVIEMRQLRKDSAKVKDIAERFGIHCVSTSRVLNRKTWSYVNGALKPHSGKRFTKKDIIKMRQLRKGGANIRHIAKRFEVRCNYVSNVLVGKKIREGICKLFTYNGTKLTEEEVIEMRQLRKDGAKVKDIAKCFGITYSYASEVVTGKVWAHVDGAITKNLHEKQYRKLIKALEIRWLKENKVRTKDIAKLYGMS
ncbi:MAG: hypothetical protein GY861_02540, partial [bacterium]|nr:hypothetical protein [bacterium]